MKYLFQVSFLMLIHLGYIQISNAQWIRTNGPEASSVRSFAINDSYIFAGTFGAGIFRSSDDGANWTAVNNGLTCNYIGGLTISGTHIIAGTDGAENNGIFLSTDNGASWTGTSTGMACVNDFVAFDDTMVLAAVDYGLWRSTDNGTTWSTVSSSPLGVGSLAISGTTIFAGTIGSEKKVYRSTDKGITWDSANSGLPGKAIFALAARDSVIFAGVYQQGVYRSTNSGTNWTLAATGMSNLLVHALVVGGSKIFAGTEGGVFMSSDDGSTWNSVSGGLTDTLIYSMAASGTNLFAGTYGPVYRLPFAYFAPLAVPSLISPANNSVDQPFAPLFVWHKDTAAINYHFQLALDSFFSSLICNDSTVADTVKRIGNLGITTTYYWRVRGANLTGYGTWSPTYTLVTHNVYPVSLSSPENNSINQSVQSVLSWSATTYVSSYRLQVSVDQSFLSLVFDDSTITTTSKQIGPLTSNTVFYWRVMTLDSGNHSPWSSNWQFRTVILPPSGVTAHSGNKAVELNWIASESPGVTKYKLYRGTSSPPSILLDSTSSTTYVDTGLVNGTRYYYGIKSQSYDYLEGPLSTEVNVTPFNQPPHSALLNSFYQPNSGNVVSVPLTFSSSGSADPDGTVDSVFWFVDGRPVSRELNLTYSFRQGTHRVMLVVKDNQGATDTSFATVNRSMFKVALQGPVYAGPSLIGGDVLYTITTGDAVYRLNSTGQVLYTIQVGGEVRSSSSISYDTTVYIASSDKNLYAFSKYGNQVWPVLALGGVLTSTPAIDSISNRLYLGVSNKNFVAVDARTGTVAWNFFADAPIVGSAVQTLDRKLAVATTSGTVYGFDLNNLGQPPSPMWQLGLSDSIVSSPAVGSEGDIYYCTTSGKIVRITMPPGEQARTVWQAQASGRISGSPVIDGAGTLYVGCEDSKLYALDTKNGTIKWRFSSCYSIESTPAVSDIGTIYFGNDGGTVYAIDSTATVLWYYQDSTAIKAPLLYHNGTLYLGTVGARFLALFDSMDVAGQYLGPGGPHSMKLTVLPSVPAWGTFQGNNRRTGTPIGKIQTNVQQNKSEIPAHFSLSQNYPNPFNPSTVISYGLPVESQVMLSVYDVLGRELQILVNKRQAGGNYSISFNAMEFPSGIYFYRLQTGTFTETKKLLLLR